MTTYVELKRDRTPVEYITLPVRYDAWGDPYVKLNLFQEMFSWGFMGTYTLGESGNAGYDVKWRHVSGPDVRFPNNRSSRGWKP